MSRIIFPQRRDDGSFSVSARFTISDTTALDAVQTSVSDWLREKNDDETNQLSVDLTAPPHVVLTADNRLDVVFEGRSGSVRWKDWVVELTRRLAQVPMITFECFYDSVARAPHPGSLDRR